MRHYVITIDDEADAERLEAWKGRILRIGPDWEDQFYGVKARVAERVSGEEVAGWIERREARRDFRASVRDRDPHPSFRVGGHWEPPIGFAPSDKALGLKPAEGVSEPQPALAECCPAGVPYYTERRFHADGSRCRHRGQSITD